MLIKKSSFLPASTDSPASERKAAFDFSNSASASKHVGTWNMNECAKFKLVRVQTEDRQQRICDWQYSNAAAGFLIITRTGKHDRQ